MNRTGVRRRVGLVVAAVVVTVGFADGPAGAAGGVVAWGTTSSAAAGARAELFGVGAAAPGDVWAVGGYNPGRSPSLVLTSPYAEHWRGTAWTATRVPLSAVYPSARQAAQLEGAVAIGSADA
jgi:hypothetical protein